MKKLLSLLLCMFLLTAMLTACGSDNKDDNKKVSPKSTASRKQEPISGADKETHGGHNHATESTAPAEKLKYQLYTNADNTYRVVFRDTAGKVVAEFDKLAHLPLKTAVNPEKGIYELGWATGSGPSDFCCVYYNVNTGAVSKLFHAPRGTDGVRIAYGSEDQTKIIVTDVFSNGSYYKEYPLEGAYTAAKDIITGGNLKPDKKTVVISYITDEKGTSQHTTVQLYE